MALGTPIHALLSGCCTVHTILSPLAEHVSLGDVRITMLPS